ncbi:MAG: hypothetical protein LUQ65_15390 [Candidatus Helarchaeota archaeon]|nr:hypothetical protein [Candidatus Helarchaeota archaeon]
MQDRSFSHLLIACLIGLLLGVTALRFSALIALGGLLGVLLLIGIAKRAEFGLLAIVFVTAGIKENKGDKRVRGELKI